MHRLHVARDHCQPAQELIATACDLSTAAVPDENTCRGQASARHGLNIYNSTPCVLTSRTEDRHKAPRMPTRRAWQLPSPLTRRSHRP